MRISEIDEAVVMSLELTKVNYLNCENQLKIKLYDYLEKYFNTNKKKAFNITDNDKRPLNFTDYNVINLEQAKDNNQFNLVNKNTIIKNYLKKVMVIEEIEFQTIQMIRDNLRELITNHGFLLIKKKLLTGINCEIEIVDNFDLDRLLTMLLIELEQLSEYDKWCIVFNAIIELEYQSDKENIILFPSNFMIENDKWFKQLITLPKILTIIPIQHNIWKIPQNGYLLNLKNNQELEKIIIENNQIEEYLYAAFINNYDAQNFQKTEINTIINHHFQEKNTIILDFTANSHFLKP